MLAGQPERLAEAFALLDPSHRALLELSLRREVADPALAELLRTDVETVGRQRIEALESLGSMLDTTAAEVEEALIDRWRGETDAEEPEAEEEADVEPTEEPDPAAPPPVPATTVRPKLEGSSRPRRRGVWLGLAAGIALVILLVSIGGGDDDDEPARPADTQASTETAPAEDPPPPDDGAAPVELAAVLESGKAGGTVQVVESGSRPRVALRLRGLSDAGYTLWLYNSIGDAQALASFRGPAPFVRARLPEGYLGFGFLDVSLEPEDGNSNHSGASVLRLPTKSLPAG